MTNLKKILNVALFVFAAAAFMTLSPVASADSGRHHHNRHNHHSESDRNHSKPKITSIDNVTRTSAVINFRAKKFKNETVTAVVSIKNGALVERQLKATLDDKGQGSVTVRRLKPGTHYEFKVRMMRMGEDKVRTNSNDKSITTAS